MEEMSEVEGLESMGASPAHLHAVGRNCDVDHDFRRSIFLAC